uniref:(California timema) hypothetical protein n=1 Tax=Timema californicum TaxID=61474 RepID=A0A7R9P4Q9_TIMCA|nr:unnamed protein product [Timema californicum]
MFLPSSWGNSGKPFPSICCAWPWKGLECLRTTLDRISNDDLILRLNKIGKNPNLVSHREEDMGSESKTINAVVNALAEQANQANTSDESMGQESSDKSIHELGRNLHELGKTLHRLNLPRPKSENNFAASQELPMDRTSRPIFHKSDTFHKDTRFPMTPSITELVRVRVKT